MRAAGEVRAHFSRRGEVTSATRVYQQGGLRLRVPNTAHGCEAVIINTGGGIAGGDQARFRFEADPGAAVTITTASAEKVYRSQGPTSRIDIDLCVGPGARLAFLPQETILFDAARLSRRFTAQMAPDASLTIVESVVFGRAAMGERMRVGSFCDRWRIRRGGRLVFAEDVRLDGDVAGILDRPACGGGARTIATVVHLAPDAEARLDGVRAGLAAARASGGPADPAAAGARNAPRGGLECAASAWNGILVVRLASASPHDLRQAIVRLVEGFRGCPMPRIWS